MAPSRRRSQRAGSQRHTSVDSAVDDVRHVPEREAAGRAGGCGEVGSKGEGRTDEVWRGAPSDEAGLVPACAGPWESWVAADRLEEEHGKDAPVVEEGVEEGERPANASVPLAV